MKGLLIFSLIFSVSAFAAEKKTPQDMRQGTKAVDEKYLKDLSGSEIPERKTISHDVHANQSKASQMESKRDRQFQEEDLNRQSTGE